MYSKPLSYSGLSLYKKCPRRWHHTYILGNRSAPGQAAQRGTYLHELLEDYFRGKIPYPSGNKALAPWQPFMEGLAKFNPVAEGEVAVNKDWKKCGFDDPEAYFRGKKDLEIDTGISCLMLFDWKSGRVYDDHIFQGKAYTAASPGYEYYRVFFVYLDSPLLIKSWTYTGKEREVLEAQLIEQIEEVRNATEYPATPSDECTYCELSWRNGGDCKRAR